MELYNGMLKKLFDCSQLVALYLFSLMLPMNFNPQILFSFSTKMNMVSNDVIGLFEELLPQN